MTMPDRLTQLQDTVNMVSKSNHSISILWIQCLWMSLINLLLCHQQAENFCNSIGVLQQCSVPSKFPGYEHSPTQNNDPDEPEPEDYAYLFSTLIAKYVLFKNKNWIL